ncbi:hypothetical protein SAMN04487854_11081 [Pseudoalteromonas lipolytica]|uniref:SMODS and SLOG-associating 2TM effector domain-containing protein n=1 Tax=Pseudoalteromonas lipolytica TaxID=570156 RepID=A0ABY1GJH4_9GAMM|nr:hypothetical protein [Pseudoalteromonas lipolytica]MBE0349918.1 hypothetical protein [Pseudoalteromonas lipolytica LMEB 39]SFT80708.1 hypothetical protein SAMN04487854_11081 [Pseudoalteromonas lipolytica]
MNSRSELFIKPNIDHLDTSTQRLKRNLLVSSIITIALSLQKVTMAKDIKFAGYNLEGLSVETLFYSLMFITLYLLIDFILSMMNHLRGNHIRLTGINVVKPTAGVYSGGHDYEPSTAEERQSSLYSWWYKQAKFAESTEKTIEKLLLEAEDSGIKDKLNNIEFSLKVLKEKKIFIQSTMIRFERSFWKLIRMQYIRFLIFDLFAPVFLAGAAIVASLCKILEL